jgi:hypothetical protein
MNPQPTSPFLTARPILGFGLLLLLCLAPMVAEHRPLGLVAAHASVAADLASKAIVVLAMLAAIAWQAQADWRRDGGPAWLTPLLLIAAGLMTAYHYTTVDRIDLAGLAGHYLDVHNNAIDPPHPYRWLPYGFIRALERLTGDWLFAWLAYRCFFTYWFLWACYRFARLVHRPHSALVVALLPLLFYPFSIQYYRGQPTDPISHFLFVLALVYILEDRWLPLAATLALGVIAKETAILAVPAYLACYGRRGLRPWVRTAGLAGVGMAVFLAVRLALGWRPGTPINGVQGLMIGTNLGIGEPLATTVVPLYENYLQPALFVVPFLAFIAWNWQRSDPRLRALFLVLTPLLLFANLCYGWMYESRNYVPLLPVLATLALPPANQVPQQKDPP